MVLNTPTGVQIYNPTSEDLCTLLKQDGALWTQGSGSASLCKSGDLVKNREEELMFYRDSEYGYVVLQLDDYKAYINDKKDKNTYVVHHIGGEPFPVPLCFFMSYEQAEEILLHYLDTGDKLNYDKWFDIHNNFDADAYYESEDYNKGTKLLKGYTIL